jgi:hypothetical protein
MSDPQHVLARWNRLQNHATGSSDAAMTLVVNVNFSALRGHDDDA